MCVENNIEIKKAPSFKYTFNNKGKKYYLDFFCPKSNLIIEIKSTYYYNLHKDLNDSKRSAVVTQGYNYIMILDKKYDDFIRIIEH